MAGYSGTPLAKKLGIKGGHTVALVGAAEDFLSVLGDLPDDVQIRAEAKKGPLDVIVFFTKERRQLEQRFERLARVLAPAGGLWIAWPKKASRVATDVTEDVVRAIGLASGLVDNKVCAIDEVWSGLRFVHRVKDR